LPVAAAAEDMIACVISGCNAGIKAEMNVSGEVYVPKADSG
jgi:hypothetical protein